MSFTSAISDLPSGGGGHEAVEDVSVTVTRANAYYVMARAFRLPGDMEVTQPQLMRDTFSHTTDSLRALAAKTADAWALALEQREALGVAYARLFLGPFEILAAPYASHYLDSSQQLMGEVSQEAARAFTEAGLGFPPGPGEAPDHVTHELEFMYYLAYQEARTAETIWRQRQYRFWTSHLSRWLSRLAKLTVQADCHPFYTALGEFVLAFSQDETAYFDAAP